MDDVPPPVAGAACLLAAGLALGACQAGAETVCSAVGWSNGLTVELAEGWPEVADGALGLDCSSPCGLQVRQGDEPDGLTVPLTGTVTVAQLGMTTPDSVTVTVLGADGVELAVHEADPDWIRVGGTEECGGPHAATVVVPVP
ncbi:hypothetical protein ACI78T_12675 [Blastococcus sp. SYSU D00922]